jgi:hypothetical protein
MANWRNRTNKHSITDINWSKGQNRLVRELKVERAPFFFKIAPSKVIPPPLHSDNELRASTLLSTSFWLVLAGAI